MICGSEVVSDMEHRFIKRKQGVGWNVPIERESICGSHTQNVGDWKRNEHADEQQSTMTSCISRARVLLHGMSLAQTHSRSKRVGTYLCWTQERLQRELSGKWIGRMRFPDSAGARVKAFTPARMEGRIAG